jgi:hypothetical protein
MVKEEESISTIMEKLFGNPDWHQVVSRPGVWAYSRASGGWQEMKQNKQEETVTTEYMRRFHADQMLAQMAEPMSDVLAAALAPTDVNMSVNDGGPSEIELAELAAKVRYYDQLTEAINQAEADRKKVQEEIKAFMGKATTAKLNGVPTFTYQNKETWRTADIKKDMPHLVAQYMVKQEVEVVDWTRFMAHHRDHVKDYQTREFRRVSGTRATRG